jgi:hypothetical protein
MNIKTTFIVGLLALTLTGMATAGSYFTMPAVAMLGTHKLKPGQYQVDVKGDQAVITNADGKSFSVPVKIEQADKKFDTTSVGTTTANGVDGVKEIDLGGSKTKLLFAQ